MGRRRRRSIFVSFCVISPCLFMTSGCSLTQLWFVFSVSFSLTHCDHRLFVHCLSEPKTIGLSSLPPSQSSVDHKEFKRCGPFDPYINAKVCTRCNISFFFPFAFLLCWLAVLCCAVLGFGLVCCCFAASEIWGGFWFHWLSVHLCPLAPYSCSLVMSKLLCLS